MRMLGLFKSIVLVVLGASLAHSQSPIITNQPPALVDAIDRHRVNFSVEASGPTLSHLWFRNDAHVAGGTNATLSLFVRLTNAGTYHVVVSNSFGAVRGSNTLVRVVPDTFGPRVLQVYLAAGETNRILVSFDEDILRSIINTNNFLVTEIDTGNRLPVTLAQVGVGNGQVRLALASNIDCAKSYQVCFFNIADIWTNYMALNSCVPIAFEVATNIVSLASTWSLYCGTGPPPPDWNTFAPAPNPPTPWCDGRAMFYSSLPLYLCSSPGTMLFGTPPHYFRKVFTVTSNLLNLPVTAVLSTLDYWQIGDAIFYLNGVEILRTYPVWDGPPCPTYTIAIGDLLARTNLLAVEVLGNFDASLTLRYARPPVLTNRPPAGDVFLCYSNHNPTELRLFWTNGMGYALEYVEALGDPWREFQPPSTNVLIEKTGHSRFYRLNKRH